MSYQLEGESVKGFSSFAEDNFPVKMTATYPGQRIVLKLHDNPPPQLAMTLSTKLDRINNFTAGQSVFFKNAVTEILKNGSEFHPADTVMKIQQLVDNQHLDTQRYVRTLGLPNEQLELQPVEPAAL